MPWITRIDEHWCDKPDSLIRIGAGSRWVCDECGAIWVVEAPDVDAPRLRSWLHVGGRN